MIIQSKGFVKRLHSISKTFLNIPQKSNNLKQVKFSLKTNKNTNQKNKKQKYMEHIINYL